MTTEDADLLNRRGSCIAILRGISLRVPHSSSWSVNVTDINATCANYDTYTADDDVVQSDSGVKSLYFWSSRFFFVTRCLVGDLE